MSAAAPTDPRLLFVRDDCFTGHNTGEGHPERPDRLRALYRHLDSADSLQRWAISGADKATNVELDLAHDPDHRHRLEALSATLQPEGSPPLAFIDPDTRLARDSLSVARCAAGALLQSVRFVLAEPQRRAFCAVRPPGHHAERSNAMGFCLFNSIAIAAQAALATPGVQRVAILDFDVHHGNGTFDIFRDDPRVLVASSFQHPFYPNRQLELPGRHLRYTPLAAGTGSSAFRQAIERDWLPALRDHGPDLLLLSAGFDGHQADPLAQLALTAQDYRWITDLLVDAAHTHCQGRIVSALEGGYDLAALCESVAAHLTGLAGSPAD
jgi:acetoin utilization deacetylase AcuC-like enzyme